MITYVSGNLFDSTAHALVNTVNTVGAMGKGIALTFKEIYPEMFAKYQELCASGELKIGSLFIHRTKNKIVVNFPTKKHWRSPSKTQYIEAGLRTFTANYDQAGIHSAAFPPLGCGNGELDFESQVRPLMEAYLSRLPIPVYIYAPRPQSNPAEHRVPDETYEWLRSSPKDLPFIEVWEDLTAIVSGESEFYTLARNTPFQANLNEIGKGITIRASGKVIQVSQEEVQEFWRLLRERGMLNAGQVPAQRSREASYVLPLLAKLPYVGKVRLGADYEAWSQNPTMALQLLPYAPKSPQRVLAFL